MTEMRNWAKNSPLSIAMGLVALGFVAMFLGWNGAAGKDFVQGQVPYLISGGLVGIGLVAAGLTIVLVQSHRRDTQALIEKLGEVSDRLEKDTAPAVEIAEVSERVRRARTRAQGNRASRAS